MTGFAANYPPLCSLIVIASRNSNSQQNNENWK